MFQSFLAVAFPVITTVVTALYLLHRVATEEQAQEMRRPPPFRPRSGFSIDSGPTTNRRPTTRPSPRNTSRDPAGDSTVTNRRTGSSAAANPRRETCKEKCAVCYEEGSLVELYPCHHKSLCEDCASRIITWNRRNCPICSKHIQGFSNII